MKKFVKRKEFAILIITLLVVLVISLMNSAFLGIENLLDLLKGNVVLGIMAFGMLPVIISSGIDLSVSSTIVFSSVVCGKMMTLLDTNLFCVTLAAILSGILIGLINGIIIAQIKIPPIITTLSMMGILLGAVLLFTNGVNISNMPDWFRKFGMLTFGGIPIQIIIFAAVGVLTWFILRYTLIGRGVYAIGDNEQSALRVGYNVKHIQIFIYSYCGALTGLAALMNTSIMQQVDPNTFSGFELNVISAVVIGGASTMGGVGTVFGTVLGVVLLGIINNGLILAKIPTFWQGIVMGSIILIAISADMISHKRAQNKLVHVDVEE
ncbi:MAG: ABC transporter permease [Hydrogenoanaerobacterium sp.]